MNLQEQVTRINEMMGTNKKLSSYQKIIDMSLESLKKTCETMNDEDNEYVSFEACDILDSNLKVNVIKTEMIDGVLNLYVDMFYKNYTYLDYYPLKLELQNELKNYLGVNKIVVKEFENQFPVEDRQW